MAIYIEDGQRVKVFVPRNISEDTVKDFLSKKTAWINRHIICDKSSEKGSGGLAYSDGAMFLFLGKTYPLRYYPYEGKKVTVRLWQDFLQISVPWAMPCDDIEPSIAHALKAWYRKQAKTMIAQRVLDLGRPFHINPEQVMVKTQKRLWGSCYPRKRMIYINWKIIMAPPQVVDYVLVHEFCHLLEPNHSSRFWQRVRSCCAAYQECVGWLKDNAPRMRFSS